MAGLCAHILLLPPSGRGALPPTPASRGTPNGSNCSRGGPEPSPLGSNGSNGSRFTHLPENPGANGSNGSRFTPLHGCPSGGREVLSGCPSENGGLLSEGGAFESENGSSDYSTLAFETALAGALCGAFLPAEGQSPKVDSLPKWTVSQSGRNSKVDGLVPASAGGLCGFFLPAEGQSPRTWVPRS